MTRLSTNVNFKKNKINRKAIIANAEPVRPKAFSSSLYGKTVNSIVQVLADNTFSADTVADPLKTTLGTGWLYKPKKSVFPFVVTSSKLISLDDTYNNIPGNQITNYTGLSESDILSTINKYLLRNPSSISQPNSLWKRVSYTLPKYKKSDHDDEALKIYFGYCRGSNGSGLKKCDTCLIKNVTVTRLSDESSCNITPSIELTQGEQSLYNLPSYLPSYNQELTYTYNPFTISSIDTINGELLIWDDLNQNDDPGLINGLSPTVDVDGSIIPSDVQIYKSGVPYGTVGQNNWSGLYFGVDDDIEDGGYTVTFDILYNTKEFTDYVYVVANHNNLWTNKIWTTIREIDGTPKTFLMEVVGGDPKSDVAILKFKCLSNYTTLKQLNVNDKIGKALALVQTLSVIDNNSISSGENVYIHSMTHSEKYSIVSGTLKNNTYGDGLIFAESVLIDIKNTQDGTIGSPIINGKGNVLGQLYFEVESLNSIGGTGGFIISRVLDNITTQYINSSNTLTNIIYNRSHIDFTYEPFDINNAVLDYSGFIISTPNTTTILPSSGIVVNLNDKQRAESLSTGDILQSVAFADSQDTKKKTITQNLGITPLYPTLSRAIYRTIPGDILTFNVLRVDEQGTGTNMSITYTTLTPTKEQSNPFDFIIQTGLIKPL